MPQHYLKVTIKPVLRVFHFLYKVLLYEITKSISANVLRIPHTSFKKTCSLNKPTTLLNKPYYFGFPLYLHIRDVYVHI